MNTLTLVVTIIGTIILATTLVCYFLNNSKIGDTLMENISQKEAVLDYKIDRERTHGLVKVTEKGEVCYDYKTKEFVVFEECYTYEVGRTKYPLCALSMFHTYCEEYL